MKIFLFKLTTIFLIPIVLIILYFIKIKIKIKIALLNVNRIGHLALNTEVTLRDISIKKIYPNDEYTILVSPSLPYHNVSNEQLVKMFSRHKNVYQSWFFYRFISVWYNLLLKTPFFFKTSHSMDVKDHNIFNSTGPTIAFNSGEIEKGNKSLDKIGVGRGKYVCVFQRDSNYLDIKEGKDQEDRDCRDSDIDTMIPSIRFLISKGYCVVRMGSHAKKEVNFKHRMFIDYPFTSHISDFNDIYIIANASFLVGSTSGICDIATLFDVPRLVVNSIPFGHSTMGKKVMFIPKKISKKDKVVPYFDNNVMKLIDESSCDRAREKGFLYIDNTEDEILEATKDFVKYLSFGGRVDSSVFYEKMNTYLEYYLRNSIYKSVDIPLCPSWIFINHDMYFNVK